MRSVIGGCVEKNRDTSWGRNGLAIIMWLEFWIAGVGCRGARWTPASSLRRAEAKASGSPIAEHRPRPRRTRGCG